MKRTAHHLLIAAAAVTSLVATTAARADNSGLTRAQVRAELAEARAAGMLDGFGEIGTTDSQLQARELHNQTEARVLLARRELQAQAQSDAGDDASLLEMASYVETGADGPLLVVVTYDGNGDLQSADTVSLTAID